MKLQWGIILYVTLSFFFGACHNSQDNFDRERKYKDYKSEFDKKFIDHFPKKINGKEATLTCKTNINKNDVGLFLYEYDVDAINLQKVISTYKDRWIANYKSTDSCLLVVNKFDTTDAFEKITIVNNVFIGDTCYQSKIPIPNFKNDDDPHKAKFPSLDSSFVIYVLEAQAKNIYQGKYVMQPDMQMPNAWKNGYSKGIAVSIHNKTIVYWSIMW